ncbi:MAG: ABC transporter permease [Phycisphaerales bacterium]
MNRILQIAKREFMSTAMTRAFIIGAFVIPGVCFLAIPLIIRLTMAAEAPKVVGTVAIIDRSGAAADGVIESLSPEAISARRGDEVGRIREAALAGEGQEILEGQDAGDGAAEGAEGVAGVPPGAGVGGDGARSLQQAMRMADRMQGLSDKIPEFTALVLDPGSVDEEAEKQRLWESPGEGESASSQLLALVVIDADAVRRGDGEEQFGTFSLFHRPRMDDRIVDEIREGVRGAIREARYAAYGQDPAWLEALTTVRRPAVREVTQEGERSSASGLAMMLPLGFMILLMLSVMIGSQYLLTTTIEEKSSRVVEVLLSAVSPMQLMSGKVLGQMLVGGVILLIYGGLGFGALAAFALADLVSPVQVAFLVAFFLLTYTMMASMTASVGAAVNELREAQSLQGPIMMAVMIPYFLWLPLSRDPNAVWAQVLSFVPPISPFVMMIRMTSSDPPAMWQPLLAVAINAVACYGFLWFAAKVFRVGLLMYGKPPNLATLIKWVRMA